MITSTSMCQALGDGTGPSSKAIYKSHGRQRLLQDEGPRREDQGGEDRHFGGHQEVDQGLYLHAPRRSLEILEFDLSSQ